MRVQLLGTLCGLKAHLVDADDPQCIVSYRSHNTSHKCAMPILILNVPILPAIYKVSTIDVIYDPCRTSTLCVMHM